MTYLLDTDYVIDYLKGQRNVVTTLNALLPEGLSLSIITIGEVYEGIYYGHNREQQETGFQYLLQTVSVLGINRTIARKFALIRGQLRMTPEGKSLTQPRDNYDLFIAATAIQHNLILVTRNFKDYERIPGLELYQ